MNKLQQSMMDGSGGGGGGKSGRKYQKKPSPMLRARTLPAIITPALNILNAQLNQQNLMMMSNQQQQQQQPIDYQSINDYQLINGSHHHHPHLGKFFS